MTNKQKDKHDHSASAAVRRRDRMLNQIEVTRIQRLHAQGVSVAGVHAPVHVLVAILGYSRRVYVQALPDETQASWWRGLEGALRPFGGVPLEVLMDHANTLVHQAKRKDQAAVFHTHRVACAPYWWV